jgi:hypothetical protein
MCAGHHGLMRATRVALAVLVVLAAVAGPVAAQPLQTAPLVEPKAKPKSAAKARALSIGVPLTILLAAYAVSATDQNTAQHVGVPMALGAVIFGPATGLWYAGHRGGKGMAVRTIAGGAIGLGALGMSSGPDGCGSGTCTGGGSQLAENAGTLLFGAGLVTLAVSWLYDVQAVGGVVERRNASSASAAGFALTPAVLPAPGGAPVPGAMLSGAF